MLEICQFIRIRGSDFVVENNGFIVLPVFAWCWV